MRATKKGSRTSPGPSFAQLMGLVLEALETGRKPDIGGWGAEPGLFSEGNYTDGRAGFASATGPNSAAGPWLTDEADAATGPEPPAAVGAEDEGEAAVRRIRERCPRLFGAALRAYMSEEAVLDALLEVAADVGRRGEAALGDFSSPALRGLAASAHRVNRELHRLVGFARFSRRADGLWTAPLEPDHDLLPALAALLAPRFSGEAFALVDLRRGYALFSGPEGFEERCGPEAEALLPDGSDAEDAALFARYFSAVENPARRNAALQRRLMPRRYWKHLVELDPASRNA